MNLDGSQMLTVANGYGLDSLAMLVGMYQRGIRPDRILHAAVGGEMDHTYAIMPVIEDWLESVGFPQTTIVKNVPKNFKHWPPYYTLEENCLTNGTLPSISFQGPGKGACSIKWKQAPQHQFLKQDETAAAEWAQGRKIIKAIGYDYSPADQKRSAKSCNTYIADKNNAQYYDFWYPLQEWRWDREENARQIRASRIPGITEEWLAYAKSSCFFCFSMQDWEVRRLPKNQLRRIVLMEARALPRLTAVDGLWGQSYTYKNGSKDGRYGPGETRTGSMTDFIYAEGLLTADEIDQIQSVPGELVKFQGDFAAGRTTQPLGMWLSENFPDMYPSYPAKATIVEIECEPELFPILGQEAYA